MLIDLLITLLPQTARPPYQLREVVRYFLQSTLISNRSHSQEITQPNNNPHQLIITLKPLLQLRNLKDNNININPRYQFGRIEIPTQHNNLKIDRGINILINFLVIYLCLCIEEIYIVETFDTYILLIHPGHYVVNEELELGFVEDFVFDHCDVDC